MSQRKRNTFQYSIQKNIFHLYDQQCICIEYTYEHVEVAISNRTDMRTGITPSIEWPLADKFRWALRVHQKTKMGPDKTAFGQTFEVPHETNFMWKYTSQRAQNGPSQKKYLL